MTEVIRTDMAFNMIDTHKRLPRRKSQAFHAVDTGQQSSDQPRSFRHSQGIHFLQTQACFPERLVHHAVAGLHMRPAGDFRNHPAVKLMQINLTENHIAQDFSPVFHHSCRGFIAAGLQGQNPDRCLVLQFFRLKAGIQFIIHTLQCTTRFSPLCISLPFSLIALNSDP